MSFRLDLKEMEQISNVQIVWILGGPGSGKGIMCKKIVEKYNCSIIGSGELLRKEASKKTHIGKKIKGLMTDGSLVPEEIIWNIMVNAIEIALLDKSDYIIFDGYPRNRFQAEKLEKNIKPCDLIIYLKADEKTIKTRLQKRAQEEGRKDDQNMKTIENRIAIFHENTGSMLKETHFKDKCVEIDAVQSKDDVFEDICNEIDKLKFMTYAMKLTNLNYHGILGAFGGGYAIIGGVVGWSLANKIPNSIAQDSAKSIIRQNWKLFSCGLIGVSLIGISTYWLLKVDPKVINDELDKATGNLKKNGNDEKGNKKNGKEEKEDKKIGKYE